MQCATLRSSPSKLSWCAVALAILWCSILPFNLPAVYLGCRWGQHVLPLLLTAHPAFPADFTSCRFHILPCHACSRQSHSRVIACMLLKGQIEAARALAVATRVITPSQLPPSCRGLKRPDQLPVQFESWTISWSDTLLKYKRTGLIRCVPWLAAFAWQELV